MEKLRRYLESFDGLSNWDVVGPLCEDAFHADLVYVTANGELTKDAFREVAKNILATGVKVSDVHIEETEPNRIEFGTTVTAADGTVTKTAATGTLAGGRVVRVQPRG